MVVEIPAFTALRVADKGNFRPREIQAAAFVLAFAQTHHDFDVARHLDVAGFVKQHADGGNVAAGAFDHRNQLVVDGRVDIDRVALKVDHDVIFSFGINFF